MEGSTESMDTGMTPLHLSLLVGFINVFFFIIYSFDSVHVIGSQESSESESDFFLKVFSRYINVFYITIDNCIFQMD